MLRVLSTTECKKSRDENGMAVALSVVFMLNYSSKDLIESWCRLIVIMLMDFLLNINFSQTFMKCPVLTTYTTSILLSMGPVQWWHSWRCCENLDI